MRKYWIPAMCLLIVCLTCGCAGKYGDVKKTNAEFADLTQAYVADLEKAESARDAAKAMNRYADKLEDFWPEMMKLSEKYPELKDQNSIPEELKESNAESEAAARKMAGSFMKIMPYMSDPEVRKAQERLGKIMMQ
ncbi:MAG: hypothetical protein HN341_06885 [Verrucomicrobia bacterium]|jgi:hypothetical protein|nr:hypothetical protein [Verrucomicrobiota bacterium]